MRIAVAGGLGFENELVRSLSGHSVFLVGSGFDLKKEKFTRPGKCEFIAEHFNHNYGHLFSECDLLMDVSDSLKSKYTVNDLSVRSRKPALLLLYDRDWAVAVTRPDKSRACLECRTYYKHPEPSLLWPDVPVADAVGLMREYVSRLPDAGLYGLDGQLQKHLAVREDCGVTHGHYRFATGERADVVSVSCSDKSVAVSPMNEVSLDLQQYRAWIEKHARIEKVTPFFLEFRYRHYHMILFRQARAVIKGTKDKNLAVALYRFFAGS